MPSLIAKLLIGSVVSTGGVGSIFLASKLMSPSNIREKLEAEGYRVLNTDAFQESKVNNQKDYEEWHKIIGTWSSDTELPKFVSSNPEAQDESAKINALKSKCKSVLDGPIEESEYSKAKKYCSVQKNKQ